MSAAATTAATGWMFQLPIESGEEEDEERRLDWPICVIRVDQSTLPTSVFGSLRRRCKETHTHTAVGVNSSDASTGWWTLIERGCDFICHSKLVAVLARKPKHSARFVSLGRVRSCDNDLRHQNNNNNSKRRPVERWAPDGHRQKVHTHTTCDANVRVTLPRKRVASVSVSVCVFVFVFVVLTVVVVVGVL